MSILPVFLGLLLILLIFGGLYLSRMAAQREQAALEIKARIRKRKARQQELEELFSTARVYDRNPQLLTLLQQLMLKETDKISALAPEAQDTQANLEYYQGLTADIEALGELAHKPDIPDSDRQINIMKRHFARLIKLLRILTEQGELTELESHEHIKRLRHSSLMLEVDAYKEQGVRAHDNGDLTTAGAYLKHAKDLLMQSELHFDSKTLHIKQISRMIAGLYSSEFHHEAENKPADSSSSDKG